MLGPLQFNTYVADLPSIAEKQDAILPSFPDDMTLYCSDKSSLSACQRVSKSLDVLAEVLSTRGLPINMDKTVGMLIRPRSLRQSPLDPAAVVSCGGLPVEMVTSTRLLGS